MSGTLRQELKQFEAAFRSEHGRDPAPADIKARPEIAQKYKQYQREKAAQKASSTAVPVASTSSRPSTAAPPPPAPVNPFKTPTKPKRTSRRPAPSAVDAQKKAEEDEPSSDVQMAAAGPASPSRRLSANCRNKRASASAMKTAEASSDAVATAAPVPPTSQERYVVANSPSKLRALAALHSSSGSPNKRSSTSSLPPISGLPPTSTDSSSSRSAAPPLFFPTTTTASPQKKAANPFASPQKGAFGAFEREEREKLRARRAELKKQRQQQQLGGSGVLGKAAARQAGAGWGSARSVPGGNSTGPTVRTPLERTLSRESAATSTMDIDEVDDFFGGGATSSQQRLIAANDGDEDDDDDEALGPSPVKPSSSQTGQNGAFASSDAVFARPFQSLMPDPPSPPQRATSSQPQSNVPIRPIPFLVPLPSSSKTASTTAATQPATTATVKTKTGSVVVVPQKRSESHESFHADRAALEEQPDAKRKKTAVANGKGKGKGKRKTNGASTTSTAAAAANESNGNKAEAKPNKEKKKSAAPEMAGEMILNLDDYDTASGEDDDDDAADADGGESRNGGKKERKRRGEQIVIHDKGWMARQKALEREKRYGAVAVADASGDEGEGDGEGADSGGEAERGEAIDILASSNDDEADGREAEDSFPDASLFYRPHEQVDLLSTHSHNQAEPRSRSRSGSPSNARRQAAEEQAALAASLPADLAALLSLRASPTKHSKSALSSSAKERQVARLLGEPGIARATTSTRQKKRVEGLLDFASEDEDAVDGQGGEGGYGDDDDDWDEEVDGWEGTGEAMDGYYSGGGDEL
ncbi:hypothetical protein JCM10908_006414 [Rhodotorula pacifica]|uniref:uncharacterized protein n=1 Tax=Rhodotorula pacifica TaxID=1495444 RepID=UPI00316F101B